MIESKKTEKAKILMIIGIRRSGTSILRKVIAASEAVEEVRFEPHELWHSVMMQHFRRFRSKEHKRRVDSFRAKGKTSKGWIGFKMALNPGIDALDWIWMPKAYPEAKLIFITRNVDDCYESYRQQDMKSKRGCIPKNAYSPLFSWLTGCFWHFCESFKDRAVLINYDKMIQDPKKELAPIWKLLNIEAPKNLGQLIKMPQNKKGIKKTEKRTVKKKDKILPPVGIEAIV